jgi:hypothetical protein
MREIVATMGAVLASEDFRYFEGKASLALMIDTPLELMLGLSLSSV